MCAVSYFIVRFLHLQQLHLQQQHQQLQQQRRRPTLDLVAIAHVFLAEGVGGASIASGQSPAPKKGMECFPCPMGEGQASHAGPTNEGWPRVVRQPLVQSGGGWEEGNRSDLARRVQWLSGPVFCRIVAIAARSVVVACESVPATRSGQSRPWV